MEKVQKVYDPSIPIKEKSPMRSMRGNIGGGMNTTKSQMIVPLQGEDLKSTGYSKLGFGQN